MRFLNKEAYPNPSLRKGILLCFVWAHYFTRARHFACTFYLHIMISHVTSHVRAKPGWLPSLGSAGRSGARSLRVVQGWQDRPGLGEAFCDGACRLMKVLSLHHRLNNTPRGLSCAPLGLTPTTGSVNVAQKGNRATRGPSYFYPPGST